MLRTSLALVMVAAFACAADFPSAEISNGMIQAKLLLPDAENGYYRATRFDWAGVISSIEYQGHQFSGQWFEHYDPKLHDAIMGPVEEFRSPDGGLGYDQAKPGGTFIRIGAGVVRKPGEAAYQMFNTYEIVDPGKWKIAGDKDHVEFTHELKGENGYSYLYKKTVLLMAGKPEMVIEHSLSNKGAKAIDTSVYDHNFFVIDKQTTGPDVVVGFSFKPKATKDLNGLAEVRGQELVYAKALEAGQSVFTEMEGFGAEASDYDFRIENRKSGAGVRIRGDRPLEKVLFWSIRTVACPEPYIRMHIEPGQAFDWKYTYDFYINEQRGGR